MRYRDVLRSSRWKDLKWLRIMAAEFACERCRWEYVGRSPRGAMKAFELHHRNYQRVGRELLEDVQVLCPECHAIEHDKFPTEVAA